MEARTPAQPGAGAAGGPRRIRGRAGRTTEGKAGRADSIGQRSVGASQETGGRGAAGAEQEDERSGDSAYRAGGTSFARWAGGTRKRNRNGDFSPCEGNELHRAPRTDYGLHY